MSREVKRIEWEGNKFEKFMGVEFFSLILFLFLSMCLSHKFVLVFLVSIFRVHKGEYV